MTLEVYTTITTSDTAVALCCGEVDVGSCSKLIDALDEILENGADRVIVDMREVTFIDSTGIGCLLHGAMAARSTGTPFKVIPGEATRSFIRASGLTAQFEYLTAEAPGSRDAQRGEQACG
jgi:anti-sigma B factor antagonist